MKRTLVLVLALALLGAPPAGALGLLLPERIAQNFIRPDMPPDEIEFIPVPPAEMIPLEITDQTVDVTIVDQVCTTKVDEKFRNNSNQQLEGTFLFPLPAGSTISDFALYINGKRQPGEMLEAGKAKSIYEGIVRRMQDPALLEYIGDNLFKCRVFPIPAQGERRIDLTFEQVLKLDNGLCRYTLPLRAPRNLKKPVKSFTLTMTVQSQRPLKAIYSPSHDVVIKREGDTKATVSLEVENMALDRDFVLMYSVDEKAFGCSLLTHRPDPDEDGYFMVLLTPKQATRDEDVLPKDVTFVVDTSGSMAGEKMDQAKNALLMCVANLDERDRFNIVAFSTDVNPLFPAVEEASKKNVEKARAFIKKLRPAGGTAINDALLEALKTKPSKGRPFQVVFMTDGKPTVGPRDPDAIIGAVKGAVGQGTRVFSLGVGDEINTKLLDRLSEAHAGVSEYIRPTEDIEVKMGAFYGKIASPVMADLKLDFGDVQVTEIYPRKLPDLFKGSQIEVVGRYRNAANVALGLSGRVGERQVKLAYDAEFPAESSANEFLQRLWAQRKVGYLMDEIRLHGLNDELKDEIVRLGKQYCIETPYTSFLVVEDEAPQPTVMRPPRPGMIFDGRRLGAAAPAPAVDDLSEGASGFGGESREALSSFSRPARKMDFEADSGAAAVETSKALNKMKDSSVVAGKKGAAVETVGARTFYRQGAVWVDSSYKDGMKTLTITWGSDAYYQLVAAYKDLSSCFALGKDVTLVHKGKAIKVVTAGGRDTMSVDEIRAFFRSKN